MCGRFTLRRINLIRAAVDAVPLLPFEEFSERPRFNVAPSQMIPLVRLDKDGKRVLDIARWGLIPSWSKSLPKIRPINARADTLATSPMFRKGFDSRRCLIPADGFYEWKASPEKKAKQPYFIHYKDDRLFTFAGLWERWHSDEDDKVIETCTIITTKPNAVLEPIHNRMPVIIRPEDRQRWLDANTPGKAVSDLLEPTDPQEMEAYAISPAVNRPANDGPELVKPKPPDEPA